MGKRNYDALLDLRSQLEGELFIDDITRLLYATDASIYREKPVAVARPRNSNDIRKIILWAGAHGMAVTPRTAGTSLAGQVVGNGIIIDVSRYMTRILEINRQEQWVRVEPGVILDELNEAVAGYGLFFGPETSTSNRCMIGGMLGNNACGSHSLIYGSTRDHVIEVRAILSDGSEAVFGPVGAEDFEKKCDGHHLEAKLYRNIKEILSDRSIQREIREQYPDPSVHRRNTGYALDILLDSAPFTEGRPPFNLSKLLAGSEGTLAIATEIKLNLVTTPPPVTGLLCVHLRTKEEAFKANLIALKYQPGAVEMMDETILNLARDNPDLQRNRFFIEGNPGAVLIIEFASHDRDSIRMVADQLIDDLRAQHLGYHFPLVFNPDTKRVWNLRKAGLGVLSNMKGDAKPLSLIEDTAVPVSSLPDYMDQFGKILEKYGLKCVYHAHIGSGELHLRPVLNPKDPHDTELFQALGMEVAMLVKKYRGSLSGEHGDGRLRGSFIPVMYGATIYGLFKTIKKTWDPKNILNPGKIIDTPPVNESLRYTPGQATRMIPTYFDFSREGGFLRAVEKCNGSGDCRKTERAGGTMCPSYMATRDENTTTRARANLLREILTRSREKNPFADKALYQILDLCLSCKGCKSECPSTIDMARFKSEFLQHYHDARGISLRTWLIAHISTINTLGGLFPRIFNFLITNKLVSGFLKWILSFAPARTLPCISRHSLRHWIRTTLPGINPQHPRNGTVYFFTDEFTNYNDTHIGIKTLTLLIKLGYRIEAPAHAESARTFFSKGLLRKARRKCIKNIMVFSKLVSDESPLIGIEPSAILSFRDEYPDICGNSYREAAGKLAKNVFLVDEFIQREFERGKIARSSFTEDPCNILLHGHCQQKSVASTASTKAMLSIPSNYRVTEIPSGCCGMAGSFGYEKEHYGLSMKIGELVLFDAVRKAQAGSVIVAPGTSCRQQILDGTGQRALHPVEILYDAIVS